MISKRILLLCAVVLAAVTTVYLSTGSSAQTSARQAAGDLEYQSGAILYQQKSAEYRALAYQAFNLAHLRLDQDLDKRSQKRISKAERKRPRAIVVDIDETVLDNSPANALSVVNNKGFNITDWYAWGEMRKAKPVPGAADFLNYAVGKGVKVFFISNRDEVQRQATIDNLKGVGIADVGSENVMLRDKDSAKGPRRALVAERYRIVMLIGDNLDDFDSMFEKKAIMERFDAADKVRESWGSRFIVLPNPMYGTWETAIYGYGRLTEEQKSEKRRNALELP